MFSQLERTCLHYEALLDELSCEAHNTSHKHKQRTGLATLKSSIKTVSTTAFQSKNSGTNNSNNNKQQQVPIINNTYSHLGVSTLQGKNYVLRPIQTNEVMHGNFSNLIQAFNTSNLPSKQHLLRTNNYSYTTIR